mgnify:CR=1 FL=1
MTGRNEAKEQFGRGAQRPGVKRRPRRPIVAGGLIPSWGTRPPGRAARPRRPIVAGAGALLLAILTTTLLTSCRTLLPSPDEELAPPALQHWRRSELAPGVELLQYQGPETTVSGEATYVSSSGGSLGFGVTISGDRELPRIQAAAVIVDLSEAELVPVAQSVGARDARKAGRSGPEEEAGGAWEAETAGEPGVAAAAETLTLRPSDVLQERAELLVAINATPFAPVPVSTGKPVDPLGVVVIGGRRISDYEPRYSALYVPEKGAPLIDSQPPEQEGWAVDGGRSGPEEKAIESAIGGFGQVLVDGEVRGGRDFRDARSGVGISEDRRRAVIFAAGGGSPGRSVGLTSRELGLWLKHLGAESGLMLDGGGSTSLAFRDSAGVSDGRSGASGSGEVRRAVNPSWGPTLGIERPVATVLAVKPK